MKKQEKRRTKLEVHVDNKKVFSHHQVDGLADVFFPYQPYQQQVQIVNVIRGAVEKGQNALVESPTGTGKTLCLLVGALSSLVKTDSRKKIFYLTRTHSQISQVVSQFKKTAYSCHLNIVASRQQFCINTNFSKLKGKHLQKACEDICRQKLCTYRQFSNTRRPRQILDLHQFKDHCKKQLVCPYFYSKQLTEKSELTILPFNYLLDWSLLERSSLDLKDAVVIFDQAHNIDSLCEQGSDIHLGVDFLGLVLGEIKAIARAQNSKTLHPQFGQKNGDREATNDFKAQVQLLMNNLKSISESEVLSRFDLLHKLEESTTTLKNNGVDEGNISEFIYRGKSILKIGFKKELQCNNLSLFLTIFQKIFQILASEEQFNKFSIVLSKTQLHFRCLDPSLCFSRIAQLQPKSIILSSGTLGDLDTWESNLKVKFEKRIIAQSFITDCHLYAQVRQKSANEVRFNFSYEGKQRDEQYSQMVKQFSQLEKIVKGGIIVAFSSYDLLDKTMRYTFSYLKKKVFFETKGAVIDQVYEKYQKEVETQTAFLFIVIKGRFSEGINFSAKLCRCLIIVGIPFLPLRDAGVVQKKRYLQSNGSRNEAEKWYSNQSFKALNQTLGRAIRNKEDYSVILLYDQRYNKEENLSQLSKWFTRCLRPPKNGYQQISSFLETAEEKIQEINSKVKTSSKAKKELMICNRLAEFSTPSKSDKGKKLKLIFESEQKTEQKPALKEIKIVEEPCYTSMKKEHQEYFLGFDEETLKKMKEEQYNGYEADEDTLSHKLEANFISFMPSNIKYKGKYDF